MLIDPIYGAVEVTEPVLLQLMETRAVRRLEGILQHGISGLLGLTSGSTRYEHSIGTMLLVRRLGGSLAEQIAALLHDVSHTALSHVIDFLYGTHGPESYHEGMKERCLGGSDVPSVLAAHGFHWRDFVHDGAFGLLERPAPALCADRLDYFLRDSRDLGLSQAEDVRRVLAHLVVHEGRIAVDELEAARFLGYTYLAADDASWSSLHEVGLYELAARAIRTGLELGAIAEADLWGTDQALWRKLCRHPEPHLQRELALVSPQTRFARGGREPDFWLSPRVRTIDPDVLKDGALRRLSTLDPAFARHRRAYLRRKRGPWPIRVLPEVPEASPPSPLPRQAGYPHLPARVSRSKMDKELPPDECQSRGRVCLTCCVSGRPLSQRIPTGYR